MRNQNKFNEQMAFRTDPTQYYWCVNCGHHGDFGKLKIRGIECESCGYDMLTTYTKEEINECENLTLDKFKRITSV